MQLFVSLELLCTVHWYYVCKAVQVPSFYFVMLQFHPLLKDFCKQKTGQCGQPSEWLMRMNTCKQARSRQQQGLMISTTHQITYTIINFVWSTTTSFIAIVIIIVMATISMVSMRLNKLGRIEFHPNPLRCFLLTNSGSSFDDIFPRESWIKLLPFPEHGLLAICASPRV